MYPLATSASRLARNFIALVKDDAVLHVSTPIECVVGIDSVGRAATLQLATSIFLKEAFTEVMSVALDHAVYDGAGIASADAMHIVPALVA